MSKFKHASLINVTYVQGSSFVKQGFKNGSRPSGYCKGDNGSFRTFNPASYLFTFEMDESKKQICFDLYSSLKDIAFEQGVSKMGKNIRAKIEAQIYEKGAMIDYKADAINLPEITL